MLEIPSFIFQEVCDASVAGLKAVILQILFYIMCYEEHTVLTVLPRFSASLFAQHSHFGYCPKPINKTLHAMKACRIFAVYMWASVFLIVLNDGFCLSEV